jgi:hypothetical protein
MFDNSGAAVAVDRPNIFDAPASRKNRSVEPATDPSADGIFGAGASLAESTPSDGPTRLQTSRRHQHAFVATSLRHAARLAAAILVAALIIAFLVAQDQPRSTPAGHTDTEAAPAKRSTTTPRQDRPRKVHRWPAPRPTRKVGHRRTQHGPRGPRRHRIRRQPAAPGAPRPHRSPRPRDAAPAAPPPQTPARAHTPAPATPRPVRVPAAAPPEFM